MTNSIPGIADIILLCMGFYIDFLAIIEYNEYIK